MSKEKWLQKKEEQKEIRARIDALHDKMEKTKQEADEAALEYCWSERLLAKTTWELHQWQANPLEEVVLIATLSDHEKIREIYELFEGGYHSMSALSLNAKIQFDDGVISLAFPSFGDMTVFVKEKGLTIDTKDIQQQIDFHHERKQNCEEKIQDLSQVLLTLTSSGAKVV